MPNDLLRKKVIIVTGAGRGIGRAIALMAAENGASVVVNDTGASSDGSGSDVGPAQEVVAEISDLGGSAVAVTDTVATWSGAHAIVDAALQSFGRVDGVINNAGILRDGIFHKMSQKDFDSVLDVHLRGSFFVSRAAAPYFRAQEKGCFVHMTSTTGLIGNVGQANYGAAKSGIVGLSKAIALDMQRYNVSSNCISPFAWSRLIGTLPTGTDAERERKHRLQEMKPEKVAALAAALCSDGCAGISGQVFGARNNEIFLFSQPRPIRSVHADGGWTPDDIVARAMPAFESSMYPLDVSADVFSWDPI